MTVRAVFDRDAALARLARRGVRRPRHRRRASPARASALDAAARGLANRAGRQARDFASGTSSKSSKLVHGGLRYLQQKEYLLVYENLPERQRLLENAPHLVEPLPFLIPLFGKDGAVHKAVAKAYSTALWLYDLTGGMRIGKRHKRISTEQALAHMPTLRADRLVAGVPLLRRPGRRRPPHPRPRRSACSTTAPWPSTYAPVAAID